MAAVLERFGLKKRVNAARALDPLDAIGSCGPRGTSVSGVFVLSRPFPKPKSLFTKD